MELPRPPVLLDVLEEHLNELDFLWEQRERFVDSPEWTLRELAAVENRAEAHLDGLRIGGAHSVDLARPALVAGERGLATAAAFVMLAFDRPELEAEVLTAFEKAPPPGRDGIRIALRHAKIDRLVPRLAKLAVEAEPSSRAAALDVLAFHRKPPPKGIVSLLGDPDPDVRKCTYDAVGRFGGPWSYDLLERSLDRDPPALRVAALRASARMGLPGLDETCRKAATRAASPAPEALTFLGVVGSPGDLTILVNATSRPGLAVAAIDGLGALGASGAVPFLLDRMVEPRLAHACGRAFSRITGASDLEASAPLPPPDDLTEEEKESWDESLPPDPAKAAAWWEREKARFRPEGRWQSGRDVSKDPLGEGFDALPLATRRDLALRERARDPRNPDLELERRPGR